MARVLVVGGAGYIGSHICKALAGRGDLPVVFDNLSAGHRHAVRWGPLFEGDIQDPVALNAAFAEHKPNAVMHFAAHIEVAEGQKRPLAFWRNNVGGVMTLLDAMMRSGVKPLVFSSTCAVYGEPSAAPITENEPRAPLNVYGQTKLAVEHMLADIARVDGVRYAALRYFNAAGASPDGDIGEEHDPESHLIPNALKAAAGIGGPMKLFGIDYDTPDGTCVRDFIHVTDLANAHLAALDRVTAGPGGFVCNVGAGVGVSVLDVLKSVERVTGVKPPYAIHSRREGDAPQLFANIARARSLLQFTPQRSDIDTIVADAWRFHATKWNPATPPEIRRSREPQP